MSGTIEKRINECDPITLLPSVFSTQHAIMVRREGWSPELDAFYRQSRGVFWDRLLVVASSEPPQTGVAGGLQPGHHALSPGQPVNLDPRALMATALEEDGILLSMLRDSMSLVLAADPWVGAAQVGEVFSAAAARFVTSAPLPITDSQVEWFTLDPAMDENDAHAACMLIAYRALAMERVMSARRVPLGRVAVCFAQAPSLYGPGLQELGRAACLRSTVASWHGGSVRYGFVATETIDIAADPDGGKPDIPLLIDCTSSPADYQLDSRAMHCDTARRRRLDARRAAAVAAGR